MYQRGGEWLYQEAGDGTGIISCEIARTTDSVQKRHYIQILYNNFHVIAGYRERALYILLRNVDKFRSCSFQLQVQYFACLGKDPCWCCDNVIEPSWSLGLFGSDPSKFRDTVLCILTIARII